MALNGRCLALAILLTVAIVASDDSKDADQDAAKPDYDYCIIGAGPGGVQLAYHMHKRNANFRVFEKGPGPGTFFKNYPRHRTLISINKRFTGKGGKASDQFNMRHDWNSLISDNETLRFTEYSDKYFAPADDLVRYMEDFVEGTGVHPYVQYNSTASIVRLSKSRQFQVTTEETGERTTCQAVVVAQGLWRPNTPEMVGSELVDEYQTMSTDRADYVNQTVAILGNANSGLETANWIFNVTKQVHLIGRRPPRFSWQTHYVGDIRAINSDHIDRYQLVGGGDTMLEMNPLPNLVKDPDGGIILIPPWAEPASESNLNALAAWKKIPSTAPLHEKIAAYHEGARGYKDLGWMHVDRVLRCLGWRFKRDLFPTEDLEPGTEATQVDLDKIDKYPVMTPTFESVNQPGIFFAGTLSHGRDFGKSSGGFIHGFRYTAGVLDKWLQVRYHGIRWPSVPLSPLRPMLLADRILGSANNGDAIYQMFGQLVDVVTITLNSQGALTGRYYSEMPRELAQRFTIGSFRFTMDLRYGKNFTGPLFDVFSVNRVTSSPPDSHLSNFLHPVVEFYTPGSTTPNNTFHILEDLRTDFTQSIHLTPTIAHFKQMLKPLPAMIREHLMAKSQDKICKETPGQCKA